MAQFNIAEAKARFSELVDGALLKLVPISVSGRRTPGSAKGQLRTAADFAAPLADFDDYR